MMCFELVRKPGEAHNPVSHGQAFAQHGGDPHALISQFYPEGVVFNKNGEKKVDVLAHLQPISGDDANIHGYIMVLRDKSLRSENAHLRQEIVNMLQENIRAPLSQAESGWSAIMSNAAGPVAPSTGQALNDLHGQYQQLILLIDNLLMMYGGFVPPPAMPQKEQITISRLVADCLQEVTPMARERQLMLDYKTVTGLPTISGNKEAITGILLQVLERMIDITGAGGRVRVESITVAAKCASAYRVQARHCPKAKSPTCLPATSKASTRSTPTARVWPCIWPEITLSAWAAKSGPSRKPAAAPLHISPCRFRRANCAALNR